MTDRQQGAQSAACLEAQSPGQFQLVGEMSFQSVPALLGRTRELFAGSGDVRVSLAAVTRADSAGVALLVDWLRESTRRQRTIIFTDVPPQMQALAQVCGVDELLALNGH